MSTSPHSAPTPSTDAPDICTGGGERAERVSGHRGSPAASIEDVLRARWLLAIDELGAAAAAEDAAQAFVLRLGCTSTEGRAIVLRAWRLLALD